MKARIMGLRVGVAIIVLLSLYHTGVVAVDPTVKIKATSPPTIESLKLIEVQRTKSVTMDCFVENKPRDSTVKWTKVSVDQQGRQSILTISQNLGVEDNTKHSIEQPTVLTWRLRIKNSQFSDNGNYTCHVATTSYGKNWVFDNRTVEVRVAPIFIEERTSSDMTVTAGDVVDLLCEAEGYPKPLIQWSRIGGALLPIGLEVYTGNIMSIPSVEAKHRGRYRCQASNMINGKVQRVTRVIILSVRFRPIIEVAHKVVYQAIGYITELQCFVEAKPFPNENQIKWIKGGASISVSSRRIKVNKVEGAFSQLIYELVFYGVEEGDYGSYICQVENGEGLSRQTISLERTDTPQASYKLGRAIQSTGEMLSSASVVASSICLLLLTSLIALL